MLKNIIPGRKIQKKYLKGLLSITAKLSPEEKAISIRLLESDIERIKAKSLSYELPIGEPITYPLYSRFREVSSWPAAFAASG
jgi:hypothetical protein